MDLSGRIEQLDELVQQAKMMPLSSSVLLNRDEVLDLLREMRESLPEEIKQARWVVKDREDLLAKARQRADQILEEARAEQLEMATQEAVVVRANEEAAGVLERAYTDSAAARREAEDYVDAKLAEFEVTMRKAVENLERIVRAMQSMAMQVQQGRDKLRGTPEEPSAGAYPAEPDAADPTESGTRA